MKKTVIQKEEKLKSEGVYEFDGPLDAVINHLKETKKEFEKLGYTDLRVELEDEWGYYDDHWTNIVFYGKKNVNVEEFVNGKERCVKVK